jgi:hypothetical protein
VDEYVGLMASFENRTTMQARKAWPGQNGQLGKARGYRKGGSENTSNNTFVHNGGGYDSETFVLGERSCSRQLFSAVVLVVRSCSRQELNPIQAQLEGICHTLAKKAKLLQRAKEAVHVLHIRLL